MKNNVVKLPAKAIEYTDDQLIDGLREELRKYIASGGKLKTLSEKCGGSPQVQTISRIIYGPTVNPRMNTVIALFIALGFSIKAIRLGR